MVLSRKCGIAPFSYDIEHRKARRERCERGTSVPRVACARGRLGDPALPQRRRTHFWKYCWPRFPLKLTASKSTLKYATLPAPADVSRL